MVYIQIFYLVQSQCTWQNWKLALLWHVLQLYNIAMAPSFTKLAKLNSRMQVIHRISGDFNIVCARYVADKIVSVCTLLSTTYNIVGSIFNCWLTWIWRALPVIETLYRGKQRLGRVIAASDCYWQLRAHRDCRCAKSKFFSFDEIHFLCLQKSWNSNATSCPTTWDGGDIWGYGGENKHQI